MTKTTYNGKTYEMGTEPAYPAKPGDVFYVKDAVRGHFYRIGPLGYTEKLLHDGSWRAQSACYPLYQAIIEVKEPELVELRWNVDHLGPEGHIDTENVCEYSNLSGAVQRALKAEKVVIEMPVEGDLVWVNDTSAKPTAWFIEGTMGASYGAWKPALDLEQALMAGRRVQIEEAG